jgi:hypothetical protein
MWTARQSERKGIGRNVTTDENDNTELCACGNKHKQKDEQLNLQCKWRDCDCVTHNLDHFVHHINLHIEVKENEDQEGVYTCLWESCEFESADSNEIVRHVNFHSYHTKIKSIGSNTLAQFSLPACTYIQVGKNLLPVLPDAFTCCWDDCD